MKKFNKILFFSTIAIIVSVFFCSYTSALSYNLGGSDRYESSIKVSRIFEKNKTVFVASGENYYDAISVSGLSYKIKAPILLVNNGDNINILNEIKRLSPNEIIIVGGINSVSSYIEYKLSNIAKVKRIAGSDRYSTSLKLLKFQQNLYPNQKKIAVVSGLNPYDAILASQFMADKGSIVLVNSTHTFEDPDYVVGGKNSVAGYNNIERISGKNRYETALNLASHSNKKSIVFANGKSPIDILLSASIAGKEDSNILLINEKGLSDKFISFLNKRNYQNIYFVGGKDRIADELKTDIFNEINKKNLTHTVSISKNHTQSNNLSKKVSLNIIGDGVFVNKDINNIFVGDLVTLTFAPNEKFYLTKLMVNDLDEISKVNENKYTFKVLGDTVIDPRFERRCFLHINGEYYTSTVAPGDMLKPGQNITITLDPPEGKTLSKLELTESHPQTGVDERRSIIAQVVNNKYSFILDNCKTIDIKWKDISSEPNDEKDFTFDPKRGAITGYNNANRLDVVIPNNIKGVEVKEVDEWAFNGYPIINSIKIPNTVTKIGDMAFSGNNLTKLTIPESVTYIGVGAFANANIKKLNLGKNVNFIARAAFKGNELSEFEIPRGIRDIPESLLENNKLVSIEIPDNISSIGSKAFKNNNLQNAVFSNSVKSISSFAFANNKLKNIILPNDCKVHPTSFDFDVTSNLPKLPEKEVSSPSDFEFDKTTATITNYLGDDSVVKIPDAIDNINVEHIACYDDYIGIRKIKKGAFEGKEITKLVLPSKLKTIDENAFKNNLIKEVNIPKSVTSIAAHAFDGNKLSNVNLPDTINNIGQYAFANNLISHASLPLSMKTIPEGLFLNNLLTNVKFFDDPSDASLKLPKDLISIGKDAFKDNKIVEFKLAPSITELSDGVLQNNKLTELYLPETIGRIGNAALASNSLQILNLPEGLGYIGKGAFQANSIESLVIPSSVETIDAGAFSYNTALNDVSFKGSTSLKDNAFYTCGIRKINFSDDTKIDGKQVFQNNNISGILNLPKNLKILGAYAFSQNFITNVNFPEGIVELRDGCLYVNSISSVSLPDSLRVIGPSVFFNNKIKNITFGRGDLKIGDGAFSKNELSDASNLVFGKNIKQIDSYAFKENMIHIVTIPTSTLLDSASFDEDVEILRN